MRRRCLALLLVSGLALPGGQARADEAAASSGLDSLLEAEARAGFSGVVLIARGDRVWFERAGGTALWAGANAGSMAFWLASCSKQFTATAVLRLQESGRLRTGDSLARFFPRVPADKRAITVRQLLTHTSGLPTAFRADGVIDRDRVVEGILALRLEAAPGAKHAYSNDGYTLLAAIVEIAAGLPFDAFVSDSLFASAGPARTGLWGHQDPGTPIAPAADPMRTQRPTNYRDGESAANWGYRGPTGAYATARDVHAWIGALRAGRIPPPARRPLRTRTGPPRAGHVARRRPGLVSRAPRR